MKKYFIPIFFLTLFFATRLINLNSLPIFTDEAIYIRWGDIALHDAFHRFISLEDGKQPLFIWLMFPFLKLISDPLIAGRLVSVLAGSFSLAGIYLVAKRLFSQKTALWASFLYIICPYFLWYDRLAIYDSLTNAFAIWSLYFTLLFYQKKDLGTAFLLGFSWGGGLLTKSSAQFFIFLFPITIILLFIRDCQNSKSATRNLQLATRYSLIFYSFIALVVALVMQNIMRLSYLYHMVGLKNLSFIVSWSEFFAHPFARFWGNFEGTFPWIITYLTIPLALISAYGLFKLLKQSFWKALILFSWFIFPYLALISFGKVVYPRFFLFMSFPFLILAAHGLSKFTKGALGVLIILSIFLYPLYFSSQIIFNVKNAPIPRNDRDQFLDDWPSGYGIPESVEFFKQVSQEEPIFVGTEGTFGLTPYALQLYLPSRDYSEITIRGYWPLNSDVIEELSLQAQDQPTYLITKDTQEPDQSWPLKEINLFKKARGDVHLGLYQVLP
ncbi:glycosyltransferase family 39 protein [Candidatus Microgenomates bacterium]|nr:glycosyltransferase family 39 protein [Candidatus Microgenomates bacterium]